MRGSTIRNLLEAPLLPVFSYGWLMTCCPGWQFIPCPGRLPDWCLPSAAEGISARFPVLIVLLSNYLVALRTCLIRA